MDALQAGLDLHRAMVNAWLQAALVSFAIDGNREAMHEFRAAFGRNPKHIIKAVERFPDTFKPENEPDLYDILAAIHLSRVKHDSLAIGYWNDYKFRHHSYDELKAAVKEGNGHGAARVPSLAEQCAELVDKFHAAYSAIKTDQMDCVDCATALAALPAVRAVLARRERAK